MSNVQRLTTCCSLYCPQPCRVTEEARLLHVFNNGHALVSTSGSSGVSNEDGCSSTVWYATATGKSRITAAVESFTGRTAECDDVRILAVAEGAVFIEAYVPYNMIQIHNNHIYPLVWAPNGTAGAGRIAFYARPTTDSSQLALAGAVPSSAVDTEVFVHFSDRVGFYPNAWGKLRVFRLNTAAAGTWTPLSEHYSAMLTFHGAPMLVYTTVTGCTALDVHALCDTDHCNPCCWVSAKCAPVMHERDCCLPLP